MTTNVYKTFCIGTKGFNGISEIDTNLHHCDRIRCTKIQARNQSRGIKVKLLISREIDFHLMMDVVIAVRHSAGLEHSHDERLKTNSL